MILDLGPTHELIRVTAEYSNAVLVAVLPYIADVSQRLNLPVAHSVSPENVIRCSISPQRRIGALDVEIGIKGDWYFAFKWGFINAIEGPRNYFFLQDPSEIPRCYGTNRISKGEAVRLARKAIANLGIPLEQVFAEQEPHVREADVGINLVPQYSVEWFGPAIQSVRVTINGETKQVEAIHFAHNPNLERPPPKITVVPPTHLLDPSRMNPEYAKRLVPFVLQAVNEYARKLALPIPLPLTTNSILRFRARENLGGPYVELELTNGWQFLYAGSVVESFDAPDNLIKSGDRPILLKDFAGKWNMTEQEAIELVESTVAKLNYPTNLVHFEVAPQVIKPAVPGIPRYVFLWYWSEPEADITQSTISAEVDADKREVKSLYYSL